MQLNIKNFILLVCFSRSDDISHINKENIHLTGSIFYSNILKHENFLKSYKGPINF